METQIPKEPQIPGGTQIPAETQTPNEKQHDSPAAEVQSAMTEVAKTETKSGPVAEDDEAARVRADYMVFYRAGKNPKKLPPSLKEQFSNLATRKELFKMWMENGKDLNKVEVEIIRRDESRTTGSHGKSAWSRRQMELDGRYTKERALKGPQKYIHMAVSLLPHGQKLEHSVFVIQDDHKAFPRGFQERLEAHANIIRDSLYPLFPFGSL